MAYPIELGPSVERQTRADDWPRLEGLISMFTSESQDMRGPVSRFRLEFPSAAKPSSSLIRMGSRGMTHTFVALRFLDLNAETR